MTTVYCVVYQVGGYAREDAPEAELGGVYTDPKRAAAHALVVHGTVKSCEIDVMPPGIENSLKEYGLLK